MKIKFLLVLVMLIFFSIEYNAQNKILTPPKPVESEKFDFNFDFEGFNMSLKEENKLLSKMKEKLKEQMKTIKKYDKNSYYNLLIESKFDNINFPFMSKENKKDKKRERKIFELEVASKSYVAKYQTANTSKKNMLKSELKKTLERLFDLKEESRKSKVKELEIQLNELRKSLNLRKVNKNEIIKRRLQELLHEDQYLEWE